MSTFKRTKCHAKFISKKDKTETKSVHICGSNVQIVEKTNELSNEDQTPSDFIQKHIRDNAETLEKMLFKFYEELLINIKKTFSGEIYRILPRNEVYNAHLSARGHIVAKAIVQIFPVPMKNLSDGNTMFDVP